MRLTNAIRDSIVNEEVRLKFDQAIKDSETRLVKEFEKEVEKNHQKIKIPQNLIDEGYIRFSNQVYLKLNKNNSYASPYSMMNSYPIQCNSNFFNINATEKIQKAYDDQQDLINNKGVFTRKLKSILYSMTTSLQLIENFPELKDYVKDEKKAMSMAIIPVSEIKDIRKQLVKR